MTTINYMKDTKKFWQDREDARAALDKKRSKESYSQKIRVVEKLRSDAVFLKGGKITSRKS